MAQDPWAEFVSPATRAPAAQSAPASQPAPRRNVTTRTLLEVPNPQQALENDLKAAEEQRKQLQNEREQIKFQQEQIDREQRGGVATTESEKTAAFLATRVANGIRDLNSVKGGQKPEILGSLVGSINQTAGNYVTSADRQRVEAAQRDILDAALTLGTGAAYTAEQLEGYRVSYFPRLGDDQATIDDKSRRLRTLLEAAKVKAGAAAPAIDEALAMVGGPTQADNTRPAAEGEAFMTERDMELQTKLNEALASGATLEQMQAIAGEYGVALKVGSQEELDRKRAAGVGVVVSPSGRMAPAAQDPRDEMGFFESIGETLTGNARSTPEVEALPDWATMPELNSFSFASAAAGLGTMMTDPQETLAVIKQQFPGVQARQDANGNIIMRSSIDGKEYAIKPGFSVSDIPRAAGALLAFTPAGRAGTATGAFAGGAATQAGIEATQAATGGQFNPDQVAIAGGGGVVGQQAGRLINAGVNRFRGGRPPAPPTGGTPAPTGGTSGSQAVQAADNLNAATGSNMNLMPADVAGPGTKNATGALSKLPFSAAILNRRAQQLTREAEKAKNALVDLAGGSAEPEAAGEQALSGAQNWLKTSRAKVNALYARARSAGGDEPVDLANAREALDQQIAELGQIPGAEADVARLTKLRQRLEQPVPVEGVKGMRTRLRDDFGSDGLRSTDLERRVGMVIDAADDDIANSLEAAGKGDASRLYREAATAHRERVQVIDDTLAPIIGRKGDAPKSGEEIMNALNAASKTKSARLGKFMSILPEEDKGVVRGTLLDRLGKATASNQDETGSAFSLETFLTNWSKMSDRAKTTLFGGELRSSLDDLAKVASARRDTNQFINFSNTGAPVAYAAAGGLIMSGPKGWAILALDGASGAILQSPAIARWIAKAPSKPAAARAHVEGLSKIAKANPALSADIIDLQSRLRAAFPASGGQAPVGVQAQQGSFSIAAQPQSEGSNTTGSGTQ